MKKLKNIQNWRKNYKIFKIESKTAKLRGIGVKLTKLLSNKAKSAKQDNIGTKFARLAKNTAETTK